MAALPALSVSDGLCALTIYSYFPLRWPIRSTSRLIARASSFASGRLANSEIRRCSSLNAAAKALRLSVSLPATAAGSATPQCAVIGLPGQTGQSSPAASSQTVNTKSRCGAPAAANSSQLLLRRPAVPRFCCCSSSIANGFTLPAGWLPALNPRKRPLPMPLRMASARMLRAELPVHRNRTLNTRSLIWAAPGKSAGGRGAPPLRRGGGRIAQRQALRPLAAVVGEKGEQRVHRRVIGGVENETAFLAAADQPDAAQVRKMERECRRREFQLVADQAGVDALGSRLHQQAKNRQPRCVSECGKAGAGSFNFHVSSIIEITRDVNRAACRLGAGTPGITNGERQACVLSMGICAQASNWLHLAPANPRVSRTPRDWRNCGKPEKRRC